MDILKKLTKNCLSFLIIFLTTSSSLAQENLVLKLENLYKNIQDAKGNFTQKSYIRDFDRTQKFSGRFYIKGDSIRWQYLGEFSQVIYINRETLIIYDKGKKQAIQSSFNEEKYGQLPLALLSRMSVLDKDFEIIQKSEKELILIPKTKMGSIKKIELTIIDENFPIKSMKIIDNHENTIKIEFQGVKINTNLRDSIFKFVPKEDDTILRY